MKVNIELSQEEKTSILDTFHILQEYHKHDTSTGAEYIKTLSLINHLSEFIDKAFINQ